jgi:hypothetical protein
VAEVVARAVVEAARPLGHRCGEQHDERDDPLLTHREGRIGSGLDLVEDAGEVHGGGGVGLHPPRGEAPAELDHDAHVGAAAVEVEPRGVGDHEAADERAQVGPLAGEGTQPATLLVDGRAPSRQDLQQEALARPEVVADRRRVALLGGLGDLAGGDAFDAAPGEEALGFVEESLAGADGEGSRGQLSSGSSALVGITLTSRPSGSGLA